jgi:hypothetical protein
MALLSSSCNRRSGQATDSFLLHKRSCANTCNKNLSLTQREKGEINGKSESYGGRRCAGKEACNHGQPTWPNSKNGNPAPSEGLAAWADTIREDLGRAATAGPSTSSSEDEVGHFQLEGGAHHVPLLARRLPDAPLDKAEVALGGECSEARAGLGGMSEVAWGKGSECCRATQPRLLQTAAPLEVAPWKARLHLHRALRASLAGAALVDKLCLARQQERVLANHGLTYPQARSEGGKCTCFSCIQVSRSPKALLSDCWEAAPWPLQGCAPRTPLNPQYPAQLHPAAHQRPRPPCSPLRP